MGTQTACLTIVGQPSYPPRDRKTWCMNACLPLFGVPRHNTLLVRKWVEPGRADATWPGFDDRSNVRYIRVINKNTSIKHHQAISGQHTRHSSFLHMFKQSGLDCKPPNLTRARTCILSRVWLRSAIECVGHVHWFCRMCQVFTYISFLVRALLQFPWRSVNYPASQVVATKYRLLY